MATYWRVAGVTGVAGCLASGVTPVRLWPLLTAPVQRTQSHRLIVRVMAGSVCLHRLPIHLVYKFVMPVLTLTP